MIDLHMHSTFSDGTYTPEELVDEAIRSELTGIALTDHDTTAGLDRLLAAAKGTALRVLPGVEISAQHNPGGMDILGYGIEYHDESFNEKLAWIRDGRNERNLEIRDKLDGLGMELTMEEIASHAGADVVGRPHFAQALMAKGFVATKQEAFDKFLATGRPAFSERPSLSTKDTIELIINAKGVPVLAHPVLLKRDPVALRALLIELKDYGLMGLEVHYPEHATDLRLTYHKLAKDLGLIATGGSDFHGAISPHIKLGRGFGGMHVPDSVFDEILASRPA